MSATAAGTTVPLNSITTISPGARGTKIPTGNLNVPVSLTPPMSIALSTG
jgi:hypothetical protein